MCQFLQNMDAQLELFIGPMFAGKTSHSVKRLGTETENYPGQVVYINSKVDDRTTNNISTHGIVLPDKLPFDTIKLGRLAERDDTFDEEYEVIGVDEAQFFPDLKEVVLIWLQQGKTIIVTGLDADSDQNKFGQVWDLIPYANKVEKSQAYCKRCAKTFDKRRVSAPYSVAKEIKTEQVKTGSNNQFEAVCHYHLHEFR